VALLQGLACLEAVDKMELGLGRMVVAKEEHSGAVSVMSINAMCSQN